MKSRVLAFTLALLAVQGVQSMKAGAGVPPPDRLQVDFTGGYDTVPEDHGRPVVLIASALGVPPAVFRKAFRGVTPAPAGQEPDPGQVHRNKDALLKVLAPYGITNDFLDRVSDYYRYDRSRGEVWRRHPAVVYARIVRGKIARFEIQDAGAGYTVAPTATVRGYGTKIKTRIAFSKDVEQNGRIVSLSTQP